MESHSTTVLWSYVVNKICCTSVFFEFRKVLLYVVLIATKTRLGSKTECVISCLCAVERQRPGVVLVASGRVATGEPGPAHHPVHERLERPAAGHPKGPHLCHAQEAAVTTGRPAPPQSLRNIRASSSQSSHFKKKKSFACYCRPNSLCANVPPPQLLLFHGKQDDSYFLQVRLLLEPVLAENEAANQSGERHYTILALLWYKKKTDQSYFDSIATTAHLVGL